jgi:hypothetical protein
LPPSFTAKSTKTTSSAPLKLMPRRILLKGQGEDFPRVPVGASRNEFVDVCELDCHSFGSFFPSDGAPE